MSSPLFTDGSNNANVDSPSNRNRGPLPNEELLEWFSPLTEKRRWPWRQSGAPDAAHRTYQSNVSEVGSSDLQAGLARAVAILKDEISRNNLCTETSKIKLQALETELHYCRDDLNLALYTFKYIYTVVRFKVQSLANPDGPSEHFDEDAESISNNEPQSATGTTFQSLSVRERAQTMLFGTILTPTWQEDETERSGGRDADDAR